MIIKCTCKHAFQDKEYGIDNRLHNPIVKDKKHSGWRCTICGTIKPLQKVDRDNVISNSIDKRNKK